LSRLADDQIDLAIVFSAKRPENAVWSADLPMAWIGRDDYGLRKNEPLRLAAFDPPCFFRAAAIASLEHAGIDWSIGYVSNTLPDLWGAVKLDLGIAVRTPAAVPAGLTILDSKHGLPDLPPFRVSLCRSATELKRPITDRLRVILEECLALSVSAAT
jgi:DNA-binding transcriptional LysR family regulator